MRGDETIMTNNCPICFNSLVTSTDYQEGTLLEEYGKCEDEHHFYTYQYAYGNTSETIGGVTIVGHHSDSKELRSLRTQQFNAVAEIERKNYLSNRAKATEKDINVESILTLEGEIIKHQTVTGVSVHVPTQEISFTVDKVRFTKEQWDKVELSENFTSTARSMSLTLIEGDNTFIKAFHGHVVSYSITAILDNIVIVENAIMVGKISKGYMND